MPDRAQRQAAEAVACEALNEIVEAWLEFAGNKQSRQFLRALAARLASPVTPGNVVPMRAPAKDPTAALSAKIWLERQLPGWLARHG